MAGDTSDQLGLSIAKKDKKEERKKTGEVQYASWRRKRGGGGGRTEETGPWSSKSNDLLSLKCRKLTASTPFDVSGTI